MAIESENNQKTPCGNHDVTIWFEQQILRNQYFHLKFTLERNLPPEWDQVAHWCPVSFIPQLVVDWIVLGRRPPVHLHQLHFAVPASNENH